MRISSNISWLGGGRPAYNGETEEKEKIKQESMETMEEGVSRIVRC